MFDIIEKAVLNDSVSRMTVRAPKIVAKAKPGQFVILRVNEYGERIPLTIADCNKETGGVTIIYQKVGKTTMLLDELDVGDTILDFIGPLGKPSELDGYKHVAVIGGGVGCAIAYPQAKFLFNSSTEVDLIVGFRTKDLIILEEEMKSVSTNFVMMTDDGSNGNKGFVTNALEEKLKNGIVYDLVIAIGPMPMMRAVCELTKRYNVKTIISMNPIMIDGTGMCGGCRLTVDGETKFACVDGPDFDGHKVDFDEAMKRLVTYKDYEIRAAKDYNCNLIKKGLDKHA